MFIRFSAFPKPISNIFLDKDLYLFKSWGFKKNQNYLILIFVDFSLITSTFPSTIKLIRVIIQLLLNIYLFR